MWRYFSVVFSFASMICYAQNNDIRLKNVIDTKEMVDICIDIFDGGTGEPQFCRPKVTTRIATPYFTISIVPDFLVGIDHDGHRLLMQPSLWQSQLVVVLEVKDNIDEVSREDWSCSAFQGEAADGLHCTFEADKGLHQYQIQGGGTMISVELFASPLAYDLLPLMTDIIETIRPQAN